MISVAVNRPPRNRRDGPAEILCGDLLAVEPENLPRLLMGSTMRLPHASSTTFRTHAPPGVRSATESDGALSPTKRIHLQGPTGQEASTWRTSFTNF